MPAILTNIKTLFTKPIALAEEKGTGRPKLSELGATGTTVFAGKITQDEYNPNCKGQKWWKLVDQMRKGDGQIRSVLQFMKLPILSLPVRFEPPSDDARDVEIAEFVESCYTKRMSITWNGFVRHVLLMLDYGFMPFEKVWKVDDDGKYVWRKFAPRMPKSITSIKVDDEGGLSGIEQTAKTSQGYKTVFIPVDKLLLFTNELEGSDYYGTSILRSAYKHWWMKDGYYKADAVAHERWGGGALDIEVPDDVMDNASEVDDLIQIAEAFRAHEKNYVIHRAGVKFNVMTPGRAGLPSSEAQVKEHNQQISSCMLLNFLDLGRTDSGSRAVADTQQDPAYLALRSICKTIEDVNNLYAIPQLVDYNYSGVREYTRMIFEPIDSEDLESFAKTVATLINAGGITISDPAIEKWIRSKLTAPEMPETIEVQKQEGIEGPSENQTIEANEPVTNCNHRHRKLSDGFVSWREPTEIEKSILKFAETKDRLDKGEKSVVSAIAETVKLQKQNLLKEALKVMNTKDDKVFDQKLDKLGLIKKTDMKVAIVRELRSVYKFGRDQLKDERRRQVARLADDPRFEPTEGDVDAMRFLRKKTEKKVSAYSDMMLTALVFAMLDQRRTGQIDMTPIAGMLDEISDRQTAKMSRNLVSDAWNLGRNTEAGAGVKAGDEIDKVLYTAIMDGNVCPNCETANGAEMEYGSSRYQDLTPPLNSREFGQCLGGRFAEGCRCTMLYLYKGRGR